jgi:hypothetical protein
MILRFPDFAEKILFLNFMKICNFETFLLHFYIRYFLKILQKFAILKKDTYFSIFHLESFLNTKMIKS